MSLNKVLTVLFASFAGLLTFSQEIPVLKDSILTQDLDEVIVTATRTVRQLSSVPLPVTSRKTGKGRLT